MIGVGRAEGARLRLLTQRFDATGQELRFAWQGTARMCRLGLVGGFLVDGFFGEPQRAQSCGPVQLVLPSLLTLF